VSKGADGLITKLLSSGVAEKWTNEIKFTNRFFSHVALHSDSIKREKGSIEAWRDMLNTFDYTLSALDDDQVGTIIVLIDYYFQTAESNPSNKS
jgi:hypothetical protein